MNKNEIKAKIEKLTEEIEDLQKQLEEAEKELKPGDIVTVCGKRCMVIAPGVDGEGVFIALRQDGEIVAVWDAIVEQRNGRTDSVEGIIRILRARECSRCKHEETLMIDEPCASCVVMYGDNDNFEEKGEE